VIVGMVCDPILWLLLLFIHACYPVCMDLDSGLMGMSERYHRYRRSYNLAIVHHCQGGLVGW
jgi:hypothetical protein